MKVVGLDTKEGRLTEHPKLIETFLADKSATRNDH
jgi:hypothetical protein